MFRRHLLRRMPFSSPPRRGQASCSCRRGSAAPLKTSTPPSSISSPSPSTTMIVAQSATETGMAMASAAAAAPAAAGSLYHKTPPPLSVKYRKRRRRRTSSSWPRPATTCADRKRRTTLNRDVVHSLAVYFSPSRQKVSRFVEIRP